MMKSYGLFGLLGFISLSFVLALPARAEDTPHVFISEINWAGSQVSSADEWIELVNLGTTPADLSGYVLTGVATNAGAIAIADGTTVEPGHTLLIANYALGDPKTSLDVIPNLVTTAISLPNSALDILFTTPAGLVIDNYTDAGTPDFGVSNPATSIERDLATMTWHSSTQSLNLLNLTQLGTPGVVSLPTVASNTTPDPEPVNPVPAEPEATSLVAVPTEPPEAPVDVGIPAVTEISLPCTPAVLENGDIAAPEPAPDQTSLAPEILLAPEPETPETPETLASGIPENTESNTLSVQKMTPGELVVNELVSDPTDGIEWVELLNTSSQALDLTGSRLEDAGAHITNLPNETLAAGALLVIDNPNGNLNNTSETITLFDSYGSVIDTLSYGTTEVPAPQDGESLARTSSGEWQITTATKNAPNTFPTPPEEVDNSSISDPTYDPLSPNAYATTTNTSDALGFDSGAAPGPVAEADNAGSPPAEPVHRIVALAKSLATTPSNSASASNSKSTASQTVITGTVVALPETFGKQIMYLDGHEIYFNAADWPELALGDLVRLSGTESTNDGAPRLKISKAEAIVVTGHTDIAPHPIDGSELAGLPHGALVSIAGQVTGKDGDKLSIMTDDGTTVTALSNKRTGVSWSSIQSGRIVVIGIVKNTNSGLSVAVRSADDVHFTPDASLQGPLTSKPKTGPSPLVGGGLLTGSVGALGTWYVRSRKGLLSWLPF